MQIGIPHDPPPWFQRWLLLHLQEVPSTHLVVRSNLLVARQPGREVLSGGRGFRSQESDSGVMGLMGVVGVVGLMASFW